MNTEPKVDQRAAQPYAGIRTLTTMEGLSTVIPQYTGEVFAWLGQHGIAPTGPPFIRYHIIDMARQLDVEMGVPVASEVSGEGLVQAGVLPAGRYASLVYTDINQGVPANRTLLQWGEAQGLVWDQWPTAEGDAWGARYESFLTDPNDEPDPAKWETEVAIRLADPPAPL
jgi:effector-binding domain-containing protein